MDLKELDGFMADSNARALRGRLLARQLLGLGIFAILLVVFLYVAAPDFTGGVPNSGYTFVVPALGIAGITVGLVWMVRIVRAKPEPDTKAWRYRQVDKVRRPSKVNWLPTTRWIATRLAMSMAIGVFAYVLLAPALHEGFGWAGAVALWLWLAAIALAAVGTFWIFRIARGNSESETRSWRYRDF